MKALFISADGFDDAELLVPYYRFLEEGIKVDIASMKKTEPIKGRHGYEVAVTKTLAEIRPETTISWCCPEEMRPRQHGKTRRQWNSRGTLS